MHGFSSGSGLLVNAEVDSMGRVVEGGVDVGNRTSPRRVAIEKVQAELRQEYDVREERRRELEFLEKGGSPLDFKLGNAASLSVQSTSLTDQHPDRFLTREAKGSFAASPHGDSVESSGRPGSSPLCEPHSADNLMLFDGENEFPEVGRNRPHPNRSALAPLEQSSQLHANQDAKELKDSAAFSLPRKAYKRRSRPNRDSTRAGSADTALAHGSHGSSLSSSHASREVKGLLSDVEIQKGQKVSVTCNSIPTSPNRVLVCNALPSDNQLEMDGANASESTADLVKCLPDAALDANASQSLLDSEDNKQTVFSGQKSPTEMVSEGNESLYERQNVDATVLEHQPRLVSSEIEDQACCDRMNGFNISTGDRKSLRNGGQNTNAAVGTKVLDSESSCTQTNVSLDEKNDCEICTDLNNKDSNVDLKDLILVPEEMPVKEEAAELVAEDKPTQPVDAVVLNIDCNSVHQSHKVNGFLVEPEEELKRSSSDLQNDVKEQIVVEAAEVVGSESDGKNDVPSRDNPIMQVETAVLVAQPGSIDSSVAELPEANPSVLDSAAAPEEEVKNVNVASKADDDSILEEAWIIQAKRKRIAELSVATFPAENRRKSHWDYVLEEMAWLANDFAQERLWKITAAAQICHRVAPRSRLRFQEQHSRWEQKRVAHMLSKSILEFWLSVEETSKEMQLMRRKKDSPLAVWEYALRFLKFNSSGILHNQAEAPVTPDRTSDLGTMDMSWEDHLTEECLFYAVPPGAIQAYRKLIESHVVQYEKTGNCIQEDVVTFACNAVIDFWSRDNNYEEEEGETGIYDCGISKSSKIAQRKQKSLTKGYGARSDEVGADLMYTHCLENKVGNRQSVLIGKRPTSSLNVSIPTKRVRTACRQRIMSLSTAGTSGCVQLPSKTDASSGDTSSFQDDQSTLHGESHMPNSLEVESVGDFEKQLPFDSAEVSKPRKKTKAKHLGSAYEQRWQVDSHFHNEQRDHHSKKRLQAQQLESNGACGLFGQHVVKKPKMMRLTLDTSFDNIDLVAGSVPSPVASQMSNMSNPNKLIKILGSRDRGRKAKGLKVPTGLQGSGSPWSLFEDQALVVLVHDMGPNWELVSDAINSTLQFKCFHRMPKECKERHKNLMDRTSGDGADSADDSGSSQPYPSTLPGIPKGSARQLFQRLQGPMEEDTFKSRFEKIIMIVQKQHYQKTQNENHDLRQLQQPHSSHMLALSEVCPNNLNEGSVLTPLDLSEATTSSADILPMGYQSQPCGGLAITNQGTSAVHGTAGMVLSNNFSSSPGSLNNSARFAVPRSATLSVDERQRMQQYSSMISSRNIQQPNISSLGAIPGTEHGTRMLPGGNGLVNTGGVKGSVSLARPGFQGIVSSSMLNSGTMLSSGTAAMPTPISLPSGTGHGQGNVMLRPRGVMHMMGASQNQEPQRQLTAPELQMQVTQANSQGVPPYGGLSSFPNQTAFPPISSYSFHHQQSHPVSPQQPPRLSPPHPHLQGANHATGAQHQAYAIRLAKGKHLQQRLMQQQQFGASDALMPHVQPQPQAPISCPLQSSQVQPQTTSPPVSFSPLTVASSITSMPQHQQKHQMSPHGHLQNSQTAGIGLTNLMGKQRPRQPQQQQQQQQQFQQAGRHHPQQRQQSQSQQQTKIVKEIGRGNTVMQQNTPIENSFVNGISTNPGSQYNERNEQTMHLIQGQGLYTGSALNSAQNAKQLVPPNSSNQSQPQQKMHPILVTPASKHMQQIPFLSDASSQGHVTPVASAPTLSACHQSAAPLMVASSNNQQPLQHSQLQVKSHQKLASHKPSNSRRVLQQNRQGRSEQPNKQQTGPSQIEQQPMSNSSHISTTMIQEGNVAINGTQVSSCASQWKASEPLSVSATSTSAMNLAKGTLPTNTAISESIEGPGQIQSSGSLPLIEHEVNAQWQHSPPKLPQPPSLPSQPQWQLEQRPPPQHPQQQALLVQVGNNSLYDRHSDSRLQLGTP